MGQAEEAEQELRRALDLRPSDWSARNYYGALLLGQGRLEEAEAEFRRVIALRPDSPRGYANLGAVCFSQGRTEDAVEMFQRSAEIQPTASALTNLGTARFYLGLYEESARAYEEAARLQGGQFQVWLNAGRAYHLAPGFSDEAVAALEQALALGEEERRVNPRDASLVAGLADVHCMLGHREEAARLADRALQLAPEDGDVLAVVAAIKEELGDREAAIRLVVRALEAGYGQWEIDHDPFLKTLREDPRYAEAVAAALLDSGPPA